MSANELMYRTSLPVSAEVARDWHDRTGAFERLSPPWMKVQVADSHGTTAPGDWKRLRLGMGPFTMDWTLDHDSLPEDGGTLGFIDKQRTGPFRAYRHEHRFIPNGAGNSILEDRITFSLPGGKVGEAIGKRIASAMDRTFAFRHRRTRLDLLAHSTSGLTPMRIAVTGSSGLVGRHLVSFLTTGGHEVFRLVRHAPSAPNEIFWDPKTGQIDAHLLEGMDAIVHLAGESIASGRWSRTRKRAIRESREQGTQLLAETVDRLNRPPAVLVSASAVGYYGDGGDRPLGENAPKGHGFLADVTEVWERATDPARTAGIRVVNLRSGVIVGAGGGLLTRVLPIFRLGAGGPLGRGLQYMSWIALDDLVSVILLAIADQSLDGPVNAVAPTPTTNRDFTRALGRSLHRPAVLPAPAPALRLAFGGMADELLLVSQRAVPDRLQQAGFQFAYPEIESALRHELGRCDFGAGSLSVPPEHEVQGALPNPA